MLNTDLVQLWGNVCGLCFAFTLLGIALASTGVLTCIFSEPESKDQVKFGKMAIVGASMTIVGILAVACITEHRMNLAAARSIESPKGP